jgi:hypothetical protein
MLYPGSGSDHFLIPDPDPNFFLSRILNEKWNASLFFSCFLFLVRKTNRDPKKNSFRIPDPGGKKAPDLDPDPQHWALNITSLFIGILGFGE